MTSEITRRNFDETYAKQGGVNRLIEMYENGLSTPEIGRVFGLQNKQVNYYLKKIVGEEYSRYPWRKALHELDFSPLRNRKDH